MPIGYGTDPSTDPAAAGMVPMNAGGAGLGALVAALTGRKRNAALAEQRGRQDALKSLLVEAQAYGARETARRDYAENQGLADLENALTPTLGPQMAHAAAVAASAKYNLGEATKAATDTQAIDFRNDARDRLLRGDYTGGNANLAAIDGKPLDLTKLADGTAYNPYALPGDQRMVTTAVGQADIGQKIAAAANSYASAQDNRASAAEHAARTHDIRAGGDGSGKPTPLNLDGSLKLLEQPQVVNGRPVTNPLTGAPSMSIDPKRLGAAMQFITAYRQGHPRASGDEALAQFVGTGEAQMRANLARGEQAKSEAQQLIAAGRITRAEAQRRLRSAGFNAIADQL